MEKFREVRGFGVLFVFLKVFGRRLEMGRGVDVFGDMEYLGSGYKKGGDVDVYGGTGCIGGE